MTQLANRPPATAPAAAKRTIIDTIQSEYVQKQVALAIPKFLTAERLTRIAITTINRNPKLQACTAESLLSALMQAAQMGIEPDGRNGHLIPRWNSKLGASECTFMPDYKGLVGLVRKSPLVADVYADVVRENDIFSLKSGLHRDLVHEIDITQKRGELIAAYAVISYKDKDATPSFVCMGREEVEAIRAKSDSWKAHIEKGWDSPWKTDAGEMWKKTALKRLFKLADLNPDIAERAAIDVEATITPLPLPPGKPTFLPQGERHALTDQAETHDEGTGESQQEPPPEPAPEPKPTPARAARRPAAKPAEPVQPEPETPLPGAEAEPQPATDAAAPLTIPEGWENAGDEYAQLRALCAPHSDAVILKVLVTYRKAEPRFTRLEDVAVAKVADMLQDPQTMVEETAEAAARTK